MFFTEYYLEDVIQMLNFVPPLPDKKKKRDDVDDDEEVTMMSTSMSRDPSLTIFSVGIWPT